MSKDDTNHIEYLKAIRKYYSDEYARILNLDSVENKKLRDYLKKADLNIWSHKNRIVRNIQILKHTFVYNKTDNITVCFKVTLDSTSCIYAYLHCRCIPGKKGASAMSPEFVCTGPTFRSQDGEYRNRVISWRQIGELFVKYAEEFEPVEKLMLDKMSAGRLMFQTDFYYPMGCIFDQTKLGDFINTNRLPLKFFILCWVHDYYNIHHKVMENHINPAYQHIIYQPEDLHVFEKLLKKLGADGYGSMSVRISNHYATINNPDYNIVELEVGQKIFPLSAIEAVKTDDINFNVWREIYITNMASNLVLNLISPSFPFINNWFYIQHAHAGLFDNLAMHSKYTHSEIATDVSSQLKAIDKYNYVNEDRKKGPISGKFFRLSRSIHKSIIYADSDIKLTDLAVCMTSEYVGRTLRDIPALIVHHEHLPGLDLAFTDTGIFTKHMFEFIYAFYCMNSKIGIFHGDLHMNNATIGRLYTMSTPDGKAYVENPHIVYLTNEDAYRFPHFGLFSMVIDFSRAIIGDYKRLEHEFSPRFAEMYFAEQRLRVMQIAYHYFPKLIEKYQTQIESLILSNFPLMFKIFTAIDTYVIMSNIRAMFSIDDAFTRGRIKIAPGANKLLDNLIAHAESLVVSNIKAVIEGRIGSPDDIEWPSLTILKKNFSDYKLDPNNLGKNENVVEIFNSTNDVVYDIEDYDTWGPLLSIEKELELRKLYKQEISKGSGGIERWLEYKQMDESPVIEALTSKYEQQEADVLQMRDWMFL